MAISSVTYGTSSVLNQSVLSLKNQMTQLQSQLTTGEKSTTYAGMGVNEGFAIAARSQLAQISAFTDTQTNVNTNIGVANTALQAMVNIGTTVQNSAYSSSQALNSSGQTIGQQTATAQLSSMLGVLNTQAGDRYLFSGTAVNTPSVASMDDIINGTTTQAGLKQVIAERQQADLGTGSPPTGRLVITAPTPTSVQVADDVAGSPFGLKVNAISTQPPAPTGPTITGPAGSPSALSLDYGVTNPNNGDSVSFEFSLPDGTTESIQLTASSATTPPAGSFAIGTTPTLTAGNLKAALTTAIGALANTSLVAASAIQAGNDFFNTVGTASGSTVSNKAAVPAPITGATALSGGANTDSLSSNFVAGDTITVNGTPITFVASGATGNQLNVTDSVQTLLSKIDSISGTATPSTVSGGLISLNDDSGSPLTVTSSDPAAFAALGFTATATGAASGSVANNKLAAPITGATLLNGAAATDSLASNFVAGDTITVNGTPITFVASGATGNQLNIGDSVQTLLSKIDLMTGTGTASTISAGGAISLHTNAGSSLAVSSSNPAALAALGFTATAAAATPPLRVSGSPLGSATSLTNGAANTIKWYTGNPGPIASARASSTARVDQSVTVEYGAQADETAIRTQLQNLAVFAAVTTSATNPNGAAQVTALSQRVAQNLTSQPGQQTIEDIQSDLATAQATMKDASARQTQAGATLQDLIDQAETVSPDQVASQVLALQNSLQASYQTTSMLSQLTLTKYLPVG